MNTADCSPFTRTFNPNHATNIRTLARIHECRDVDMSLWGTGHWKSRARLARSLLRDDVNLEIVDGAGLLRVHVAVVHVRQGNNGPIVRELEEVKQRFENGEERKRNFSGSLGETVRMSEVGNVRLAAERALAEELGQTVPAFKDPTKYSLLRRQRAPVIQGPQESECYQGLRVIFTREIYLCIITPELYAPEYREIQEGDKVTIFRWRSLHSDEW